MPSIFPQSVLVWFSIYAMDVYGEDIFCLLLFPIYNKFVQFIHKWIIFVMVICFKSMLIRLHNTCILFCKQSKMTA